MSFHLRFTTSKFDVKKEERNATNPIFGQSLLLWLQRQVDDTLEMEEPDSEDWGWYSHINWKGRRYLVAASAMQINNGACKWMLRLDKNRSLKEIIFAQEKMNKDDECLAYFKYLLGSEVDFKAIELE